MTETRMVQVMCPDCRREFDVPDGAAEAQCPQCGETLVWRSCLDTNEVFTVLKKWETWIHPGCDTKHPVDLTHVLSAARPQGLDPSTNPVQRPVEPTTEQMVYSPVQLAEDVEWADQDISGRLIVDSDRVAILPGAGVARPPLSVAWLRDVLDYTVQRGEGDGQKRKLFGRKKDGKDVASRPSVVVFTVPGGQISIASSDQPDVLLANLDQYLRPRMTAPGAPPAAPPTPPQAPQQPPAVPTTAPAGNQSAVAPAAPPQGPLSTPPAPPQAPGAPSTPPAAPQAVAPTTSPQSQVGVVTPAGVPQGAAGAQPPAVQPPAAPTAVLTPPAPAAADGPHAADVGAAPQTAGSAEPAAMPDLEPDTPEGVYESIRKLAELAVLGTISSEEFKAKKAQLLARL